MSPPSAQRPPDLGTTIAGRYVLTRFLGSGGMGAVYEARVDNEPPVAVKLILSVQQRGGARSTETVRFSREAVAGGAIDDEHVVKVLESGIDPPTSFPFLVMPLLVGTSLDEVIRQIGPLHPTVAARVVRQACLGVAAAHRTDLVHRDIKSANLFLDQDESGRITVRVLDFGVAKFLSGTEVTTTGSLLGTPLYMSPEQVTDAKRVDQRADVWSLGVTLYQALTGDFPFDRDIGFAKLALAITTSDPKHVQELAPWVDPGLAAIVHGTLIRDRDRRCPSAIDLSAALLPYTGGTDEIDASMLTPLESSVRDHRSARVRIPDAWSPVEPFAPTLELLPARVDPIIGRTIGGRFKVLRAIGMGGMGAVYEAAQPDGTRLALKLIRPDVAGFSMTARRRFVREARVIQSIDDEHVVQVIETETDPELGLPYIAMELLDGHDLERVVKSQGALPPKTAARLFVQACRGLSAAHAKGFIHRDVKPSNIVLARKGATKVVVKVCDFGIAKQLDGGNDSTAGATKTGNLIGSPMYMSPEQAVNAKDIDARTDIWSLGATLYEALTGLPPWSGREGVGQLVLAICSQELVAVRTHAPWVPPALADIVHKAMSREAADRYASVDEMSEALAAFIGGSTELSPMDLRPLSDAERSRGREKDKSTTAKSAPGKDSAPTLTRSAVSVDSDKPPASNERPKRSVWPWIGVAAAVAVGAGALALSSSGGSSARESGTAPPAESSPVAKPSGPPLEVSTARPAQSAEPPTSVPSTTASSSARPSTPKTTPTGRPTTTGAKPNDSGAPASSSPAPANTWR